MAAVEAENLSLTEQETAALRDIVDDEDDLVKSSNKRRRHDDHHHHIDDHENARRIESMTAANVGAHGFSLVGAAAIKDDDSSTRKDDDHSIKRQRLPSTGDIESKKRNQRLFGSILGTLNKAKLETEHKTASQLKREELEKKLQEKLTKEKEELEAKVRQDNEERRDKFLAARKADDEKRSTIATQHLRAQKQYQSNWLKTTAHPPIYYLPAKLNDQVQQKLDDAKRQAVVETMKVTSGNTSDDAAEGKTENNDIPESEPVGASPPKEEGDSGPEIMNTDAAMMQQELGGDAPLADDDQTMDLGM